ncbi:MAG: SGNH/GDSL hydrolase family protein [Bacteroidales bacterium]|nr:SGNH/GDSL hydrolase family protein [Bacteroidales bacterium]
MRIKRFLFSAAALVMMIPAVAQSVWHNPLTEGDEPFVQGRAWNAEIGQNYHRFPDRAKDMVRPAVWSLSLCSSGLFVDFFTNAEDIVIRYNVKNGKNADNIPKFAKSGIDIYRIDKDGVQHWVNLFGHYNFGKTNEDQIVWTFNKLSPSDAKNGDEYRIYLPMYSEVENLEIGVPEGKVFRFAPNRNERPIVVYGTSIAMGASPSRNGMAWTNILQRRFDTPVINLAFSGNGRLEDEVFSLLSEIDARVYILDCMPNMAGYLDSVVVRTVRGVKMLRAKNDAPIILADDMWYNYTNLHRMPQLYAKQKEAYETLISMGFKDIYYVTAEDFGFETDDYGDGSHPNDLGMKKYADAYEKILRDVLDIHPMEKFQPVAQRRDIATYEWVDRHAAVVERNRTADPEIVLIGDSITHFWGGEPHVGNKWNGEDSWEKLFKGKSVTNMGYGWDRVENVAWRIFNGELDDCHPKHIFLMLGTNNMGLNQNSDIADGVVWTVKELRKRQPQAKIHVEMIYPRSSQMENVSQTNALIKERLPIDSMVDVIDLTETLSLKGQPGVVNPDCFLADKLHPNAEGYRRIAKVLKKYL